eukprot:scaffold16171_cov161-Amphora_coffeaeformis.AAC.3
MALNPNDNTVSYQPLRKEEDPPLASQVLARDGDVDDEEEEAEGKCCRICLEDEDDHHDEGDVMIAPCQCKGTAKWVHRDCLDLWRTNEKDRAFAQCTECQFRYLFEAPPSTSDREQLLAHRRAKFCLFVTRDFCIVTAVVQLVIAILGYLAMIMDETNGSVLVDVFDGGKCTNEEDKYKLAHSFYWCHHKMAVYYLYGVFGLLVLLGLFGSTILCSNGCKVPDLSDNAAATLDNEENPSQREQRTNYYQSHRRQRRGRSIRNREIDDTCGPCCCCLPGPRDGYYAPYYYPHYHPIYVVDTSTGGRCDWDCNCIPSSFHAGGSGSGGSSGGNSDSSDMMHILIILVLVFLVVMAVIGFLVGLFLGVVVGQRILQRHMFRLQKRQLVKEFRVVDLSSSSVVRDASSFVDGPTAAELRDDEENGDGRSMQMHSVNKACLHPDDVSHLRKLGLLD